MQAEHPELIDAIKENESGVMAVWFDKAGAVPHNLYIYYCWVSAGDNRYVAICGASKYSVDTKLEVWVMAGAVVLAVLVAVYMMISLMLVTYIKYTYESVYGEKQE